MPPYPQLPNPLLNRAYCWQEPRTELDIQPRSGPVLVSVQYEIPEHRVGEFLEAMADRHRIRRRDGAHHWTLMRDLESPRLWVETFEMPTWVDYVRLHSRTTHADAPVGDRIRALHTGTNPPVVRRMIIRDPSRERPDSGMRETTDLQP